MALPQPNTVMRMHYLATERGCQLVGAVSGESESYALVEAYNGAAAVGPGASLATTESYLASVDPTITAAS